jgi:type II secretory pathway component GspD/PulD (secretin)
MKKHLTALFLGLAASTLLCVAQDKYAPAPVPDKPTPAPAPAPPSPAAPVPTAPAASTTATPVRASGAITPADLANNDTPGATNAAPADKPAGGAGADTPAKPDEPVPLIVIEDVPLTDAIRNLARQANLNFQFDPRISASNQPNVSIRFENVSSTEALNAVLDNYNYALVKDPKSKIARITLKDPKAEEPLVSKVVQLRYADASNLVTIVKQTLSPRSSVLADPRTANLIVSTTDKEMDKTVELISLLDSPTKQVLIEARLLETSRNPSTVKGIDWAGTFEAQKVSLGNNLQLNQPPEALNNTLSTARPKLIVDTAKGFNPATAFLDADGLSAVLSFFNKDTESEVVATPRAVMLDNQTATLSVTRAFPIFQVTPGSANSPAGASIQYTNLGTILTVTPRVASDNHITLRVVPEVSNIDSKDQQVLNGAVNTANIYAIRRMDTSVTIPSGNTLVMGGLINDSKSKAYSKVPLLGDIPGLSKVFGKESKTRNKNNLLIFLTPTIVEDADFQTTTSGRDFMQTRVAERPEGKEKAIDSARPYDWSKPNE